MKIFNLELLQKEFKRLLVVITLICAILSVTSSYAQNEILSPKGRDGIREAEKKRARHGIKTITETEKIVDKYEKIGEKDTAFRLWGSYTGKKIHKYDKNGQRVASEEYGEVSDRDVFRKKELFKYDVNGLLVEETCYSNEYANPVESIQESEEFLTRLVTCKNDEKGKRVWQESYVDNGTLSQKVVYEYNEKECVDKVSIYSDEKCKDLRGGYSCKYDHKGNLIEKAIYNSEKKTTFKYDDNNNLIEKIISTGATKWETGQVSPSETYRVIYKYDDAGNNIEYGNYDMEGDLLTDDKNANFGIWKYDDKGNQITFVDYIVVKKFGKVQKIPKEYITTEYTYYSENGGKDVDTKIGPKASKTKNSDSDKIKQLVDQARENKANNSDSNESSIAHSTQSQKTPKDDIEEGLTANQYLDKGDEFYNKEDWANAVRYYTKAIEKRSDWSMAYSDRGMAKYKMGDYESAMYDFDAARKLDPSRKSQCDKMLDDCKRHLNK